MYTPMERDSLSQSFSIDEKANQKGKRFKCHIMIVSYPRLSPRGLRGLSIFNVILWIVLTVTTISIVVRYSNLGQGSKDDDIGGLDYIFAGIWTSFFYGIAGIIGICCSYERKRSQLVTVIIFNVLAIIGATVTGCIAGIIGFYIIRNQSMVCYPEPYKYESSYQDCIIWMSLEFTLLAFSVIAGINNLSSLIVALVGLCGPKKSNGLVRMEVGNPIYDHKRRPSA